VGAGAYQCGGTHAQHMGKIGKVTIKKLVGRRGIVRCRIQLASIGIGIAEVEMENESRKCIKGDLESKIALHQWFTNHPSMAMSLNCRVLRVVFTY
jgi:alanyl-tRNA synthetase